MRIAFDIGGVLSKYPDEFVQLLQSLKSDHDLFVITDMHDKDEVVRTLENNGFSFIKPENVYCANYTSHGEMCKAFLLKELKIDMFFDDFSGYLQWDQSLGPAPIRLQIQPDAYRPYWAESWKTDCDSDFGRRVTIKQ